MTVTADELEDLALALAREPASEAERRCAISRAYAGARRLVQALEPHLEAPAADTPPTTDRLIRALLAAECPVADASTRQRLRTLGYLLKRLKERQVTADHALEQRIGSEHAEHALQGLERIEAVLDELSALLPEPHQARD